MKKVFTDAVMPNRISKSMKDSKALKLFNVPAGDANLTYKAKFVSDDSWTESKFSY